MFAQEETSSDTELRHAAETIGFFAINAGIIFGNAASVDNFDVGIRVTVAGTEYDQVNFGGGTLSGFLTVSLTDGFVPSNLTSSTS